LLPGLVEKTAGCRALGSGFQGNQRRRPRIELGGASHYPRRARPAGRTEG
jgi:hypothetical protein